MNVVECKITFQTYSVDLENHGNPDFYPPVQSYGTQSAPQFGSQMYGYGINTIDGINYQQLHNSELKHQDEHSMQSKRKRTLSIDGDEMGNLFTVQLLKYFMK